MRRVYYLFYAFLVLLLCTAASAQITVSNIRAKQLPDRTVEVLYDLAGGSDDSCSVSLYFSSNGGTSYYIVPKTRSGAIGSGQKPGTNKRIIWDAEKDIPGRYGEQYKALVIANNVNAIEHEVSLPGGGSITMVYVAHDENFDTCDAFGKPIHLPGYWIGKYEVTRGQYKQFIENGGYTNRSLWSDDGWSWITTGNHTQPMYFEPDQNWHLDSSTSFVQTDNHPVVGVTRWEAEAFCNWAHLALPDEFQWLKASLWNGYGLHLYPWGNDYRPEFYNGQDGLINGLVSGQFGHTTAVGSYPNDRSSYGCFDMGGNVSEICQGNILGANWCMTGARTDQDYCTGFRVVSTPQ